ncbi:MAG: DUF3857 domain-containing protein, partial [Desulfobacteraceae bacterium]
MKHLLDGSRSHLFLSLTFFIMTIVVPRAQAAANNLPSHLAALIEIADDKGMLTDTGAVILEREVDIFENQDGTCILRKKIAGMVLDQKSASDYGQITSSYNSHFEEISLDYARAYVDQREVLTVSKDAVQIKSLPSLNGEKTYSDIRALTFSLPGLAPGTVFEYQISCKLRPVISGGWSRRFHFHYILSNPFIQQMPRIDAVLKSTITMNLPESSSLNYSLNNTDAALKIEKKSQRVIYSWGLENLAPVVPELNMPTMDHLVPSISASTFDGWNHIDQWAFDQFRPSCAPTPRIEKLAHSLTEQIDDSAGKIKAVYKYVQSNIEYVMADFGRSGYKPHPAGEVLKNGYGDCKDQTVLVISMLKTLGINAYPALMIPFPYRNVDKKIPTHAFGHAIAYIPMKSGDIWIDTTSNSRFPVLFWVNQDRSAFIVDGKGGHFRKTPKINE